jgi:hypothetical protein
VIKNEDIHKVADKLMDLANHSFKAKGKWIQIVSKPEIEALAADAILNSDATIIDERTIRLLIENSPNLTMLMEQRLEQKIEPNKNNIKEFKNILKDVRVLRSTELVTIAYKIGLLDKYLIKEEPEKKARVKLLNAILWAVKVRGCAISHEEIDQIVKLEA